MVKSDVFEGEDVKAERIVAKFMASYPSFAVDCVPPELNIFIAVYYPGIGYLKRGLSDFCPMWC
jgi:hypothetical protein